MNFIELTMPLSHQWMPDEVLPTSVKFFLGPKDHQEKGIVVGSDTGTCLTLPRCLRIFARPPGSMSCRLRSSFCGQPLLPPSQRANEEEITRTDVEKALDASRPAKGDALLITTGWGDRSFRDLEGGAYVLQSPHFSLRGGKIFRRKDADNENDLLLVDTALLGWPGNYLIPEWCSMLPTPPVESGEARMYLHLYNTDKAKADFAVEMEFARLGIMTVRKLVHCGQIKKPKVKVIVAPLQIVRGVAATCRVVAVED